MQLEEGQRGRVSGRGSGVEGGVGAGRPPMKIGPPWGGQREGAPATHNKGKWMASPSLEVGPSKQAWGEPAMAGPPGPTVYSLTSGALVEQSAGESWSIAEALLRCQAEELERLLATCGEERDGLWRELDKAQKEWDLAHRDKEIAVGTTTERLLGQGASHPPQRSVSSTGVHSQWVGEDARGSPPRIGAGGHTDGASAGGTLAEGNGRPRSVVGGGGGCGRAAPGASQSPGNGSSAAGGGSGGKDSGGRFGGEGE
ncbi:hypothetical protein C0989_007107 [Termitomyces sp. Mn162]|nr:hypothetical protein C0989_007107 [Termitomyces sp. Mn162]